MFREGHIIGKFNQLKFKDNIKSIDLLSPPSFYHYLTGINKINNQAKIHYYVYILMVKIIIELIVLYFKIIILIRILVVFIKKNQIMMKIMIY